MEAQRISKENNEAEGFTEGERESYKCLSPRKHGVSLSSHTWNCSSDQSKALMEISQSDITPTLAAGQHGFLSAFPLSAISRSTCLCKYGYCWCLSLPSPALVVSPPITNATPLTRHISPPFSHPLPSTSFAQDGWESRKGKKKIKVSILTSPYSLTLMFIQTLKHGNVFEEREKGSRPRVEWEDWSWS